MDIKLDIINENDEVVGQGEDLDMHKKELLHRSVHTLIVKNNKFYLRKRAADRPRYPNYYTTPVGVHVLSGQTYEQVAKESLEKMYGLSLTLKFLGIVRVHDEYENEISYTYAVEITDEEIKPTNNEYGEFFTANEIDNLAKTEKITPYVLEAIKLHFKLKVED